MKLLLLLILSVSVFSCKPEASNKKKSNNNTSSRGTPDYDYPGYNPSYPDGGSSDCSLTGTCASGSAGYVITKNGIESGYPTTLIAGVSKKTQWAFEIRRRVSSGSDASSFQPGNYKARLQNGASVPGININKSGGANFYASVYAQSPSNGNIYVEVIDIDKCNAAGRYGSSCSDEYTFPSELVENVSIPYQIANGINSGSTSTTCAAIGAGASVSGSITGENNGIFDAIIGVAEEILNRNNDCY